MSDEKLVERIVIGKSFHTGGKTWPVGSTIMVTPGAAKIHAKQLVSTKVATAQAEAAAAIAADNEDEVEVEVETPAKKAQQEAIKRAANQ